MKEILNIWFMFDMIYIYLVYYIIVIKMFLSLNWILKKIGNIGLFKFLKMLGEKKDNYFLII